MLKIIGAALPRTGTMSVKKAFEILGVGQSYHMHEVFLHTDHAAIWNNIHNSTVDWPSLLSGYSVTLDTPACLYWRELYSVFPQAKILLLQRDPEKWYDSVYTTIYQVIQKKDIETNLPLQMVKNLFFLQFMEGCFEDKAFAIDKYHHYCQEVKDIIPKEKLLIYEVSQGWQPLCQFLGCNIPNEIFPQKNIRKEFQRQNNIK
ncbi:sulfotransferase family protein [Candidatus Uabimicrobium sp. HlEnr_7]|uniref:sulfotransferase family protein n=1 Tax=Candidatus Uabimicrobium helgolandensis TaxID=3095367 RepID=UPI0035589CB7